MYRLTVIAGPSNAQPARGSTFAVGNGSFTIGRHSGNEIVLQSGNVSKRHCVLVVDNTRIALEDQGSSNGTFVNDFLAAQKNLQPGDRIRVGEFVLELSDTEAPKALAAKNHSDLAFPNHLSVVSDTYSHGSPASANTPALEEDVMPKDIVGKIKFHFDRYVLPYFFSFNERFEWRVVVGSLFGLYLILNLFISISPLMTEQEKAIEREVSLRAKVMARDIAERNTGYIASKNESKLELGSFDKAWGVRVAVIVDLENKILAPASRAGRYFELGSEATTAVRARKLFIDGKQDGFVTKSDAETIVAVEPIQVFNAAQGKNQTAAMAVVSIDTTVAVTEGAQLLMVYAHTLVLSLIVGLLIFYLIYRITLRPFQEMNRKIDQVLRGEAVEFKSTVFFSEIESLWNVMDSALKRVPRNDDANSSGGQTSTGSSVLNAHDFLGPLRAIGIASKNAVAVLDEERKVLFLNSNFEEITGVRLESSEGQPLSQMVRDQAFSSVVNDLCDRVAPGTEGSGDDFEFSGEFFQVQAVAFGSFGDPKCFVFTLVRKEE